MPTMTNRLTQLYLCCLLLILVSMTVGGCAGSRRCSSCETPYTVYSRPVDGCSPVPFVNAPCGSMCVQPQSRYWNENYATYNPYYSQGWYSSSVPYGRNYKHRYFGTCGNNGY